MPDKTGEKEPPNMRDQTLAKVDWCDPDCLFHNSGDALHHTEEEIDRFRQTIKDYAGAQPVVIDGSGEIIAGQGRVEAAQSLNIDKIPALSLVDLSGDDMDHYIEVLKQFSDCVGWSAEMLQVDLQDLLSIRKEMKEDAI